MKEHRMPGFAHHDFHVMSDGQIYALHASKLKLEESQELTNESCKHLRLRIDYLTKFNQKSKRVWKWATTEAKELREDLKKIDCNSELAKKHYIKARKDTDKEVSLDWSHPNSVQVLENNKWYQAGDKRFKPGNILISARNINKVFILDTTNGQVAWSYTGAINNKLELQHEARMIPSGFPGAGNILIYDNGGLRKYTKIREINPLNKEVVWSYGQKDKKSSQYFLSGIVGTQQRLKNGDTFISADVRGKVFIVNPKKQRLWSFTNNFFKETRRPHLYPKGYCPEIDKLLEENSKVL